MRRLAVLMLMAPLLLAGCAAAEEQQPTTVPEETVIEMTVTAPTTEPMVYPDPEDMVFVAVTDYIPDIQIDLRYATADNFTGHVIYEFSTVYLRYGTVQKLAAVQADLRELGLGLKIWDGFRPVSAQFKLWEILPDDRYVADPRKGFSAHSRGNTVDVTLVDAEGRDVEMPTEFDDFSAKADRDYSDCSKAAADNALILEVLMEKHGFNPYFSEWWHFSDTVKYPVEETFQPTFYTSS